MVAMFPKAGAPWRRIVRTINLGGRRFYDELECGHRETGQSLGKKRRCRTCADPTFPGIDTEPTPKIPVVDATPSPLPSPAEVSPPSPASAIPLILTVDEVAELLRVNRKTVYQAAANGDIPGVRRLGHRTLRFYGPALAQWLQTGTGSRTGRRARR
jgi:excisionase family DNA binding protein